MTHRRISGLICAGLLSCAACGGASENEPQKLQQAADLVELTYTLTPRPGPQGESAVDVVLEFDGDTDGITELRLGLPWADQQSAHLRFRSLEISGGELVPDAEGPDAEALQPQYEIRHDAGAKVRVSYRLLEQDGPDPLNNSGYFHAPVVRSDHVQLIGWSAFAVPRFDTREVRVADYSRKIIWADLPEGWVSVQNPELKRGVNASQRNLEESVTLAGTLEHATRKIGDKTLTVARYGDWPFEHAALSDRLGTILTALNEAWAEEPADYLVTLLPVPAGDHISTIAGTGLANAFAAASSFGLSLDDITGILTHEVAHNWIPRKLGTFPEEGTRGMYWFSEGFTEFSARTLMREVGLMSEADFIAKMNADLRDYYLSPARNAKVDALIAGFWTDPDIERQPYLRGFLIASIWDAGIRAHSDGEATLMDALRSLKAKAAAAPEFPSLTPAYLTGHFTEWTGKDALDDITRYIDAGETIIPPADYFGACYVLEDTPIAQYDVGFNVETTFADGSVKGVVAGSTAEVAGLQDGMRLIRRVSGGQGDTSGPITLEVAEGDRVFELSYLPVSGTPLTVPQYIAAPGDARSC